MAAPTGGPTGQGRNPPAAQAATRSEAEIMEESAMLEALRQIEQSELAAAQNASRATAPIYVNRAPVASRPAPALVGLASAQSSLSAAAPTRAATISATMPRPAPIPAVLPTPVVPTRSGTISATMPRPAPIPAVLPTPVAPVVTPAALSISATMPRPVQTPVAPVVTPVASSISATMPRPAPIPTAPAPVAPVVTPAVSPVSPPGGVDPLAALFGQGAPSGAQAINPLAALMAMAAAAAQAQTPTGAPTQAAPAFNPQALMASLASQFLPQPTAPTTPVSPTPVAPIPAVVSGSVATPASSQARTPTILGHREIPIIRSSQSGVPSSPAQVPVSSGSALQSRLVGVVVPPALRGTVEGARLQSLVPGSAGSVSASPVHAAVSTPVRQPVQTVTTPSPVHAAVSTPVRQPAQTVTPSRPAVAASSPVSQDDIQVLMLQVQGLQQQVEHLQQIDREKDALITMIASRNEELELINAQLRTFGAESSAVQAATGPGLGLVSVAPRPAPLLTVPVSASVPRRSPDEQNRS